MNPDKPTIRVSAAIVGRNGRFLLSKRPRGGHMGGYWEFPGGKIESGEQPDEALAREMKEELGVIIGPATPLETIEHEYPERRVELNFLQTTIESGVVRPFEVAALGWFTPAEIADLNILPADRPLIEKLEALSREDGHV